MSIAEKLQSIVDSKASIKAAIIAKGVAVADLDALSTYAAKIGSIVAGETEEKTKLAGYIDGSLTELTAAELSGLVEIPPKGMSDNHGVLVVTLPDSCTTIDTKAFMSSYTMEKIYIPASVTTIGASAFLYCDALKNIYVYSVDGTTVPAGAPWGADAATVTPCKVKGE